jgi:hypothetical protein
METLASTRSAALRTALTRQVPLVRDRSAVLLLANQRHSGGHDVDPVEMAAQYGFQRAEDGQAPDCFGVATVYKDHLASVNGDARVVTVAQRQVRDGDDVRLFDEQVAGIPTEPGLLANGVEKLGRLRSGLMTIESIFKKVMFAELAIRSGLPSTDWVAAFATDKFDVDAKAPAGLFARTGDFTRMGHLLAALFRAPGFRPGSPPYEEHSLPSDLAVLAELISLMRERDAAPGGSLVDFYRQLVDLGAFTQARLYSARLWHRTIGPDNVGVQQINDFGAMTAADRQHSVPYGHSGNIMSYGFSVDGEQIMRSYFGLDLKTAFEAAATPEELAQLQAINGKGHALELFDKHLGTELLTHLGFDRGEAEATPTHPGRAHPSRASQRPAGAYVVSRRARCAEGTLPAARSAHRGVDSLLRDRERRPDRGTLEWAVPSYPHHSARRPARRSPDALPATR